MINFRINLLDNSNLSIIVSWICRLVALQYAQQPAESYGVFDNHYATSSGAIYSQNSATHPYDYNSSSLQTTTNAAAAGRLADRTTIIVS